MRTSRPLLQTIPLYLRFQSGIPITTANRFRASLITHFNAQDPKRLISSQSTGQSENSSDEGNGGNDSIGPDEKGLEGKYSSALFNVAKASNKLEMVYSNLENLQAALKEPSTMSSLLLSSHFKIPDKSQKSFIDTFKIDFNWDQLSINFIELLITNKRFYMIDSIFKSFERLYRAHKGIKFCQITTVKDLSINQKNEILDVLQKRVGNDFTLLPNFSSNPSILGGMIVNLDEQVLDFSISSRIERLHNELLEPLSK